MGKRRSHNQVVDEATRIVMAYNRAVLFDYDKPTVWLSIGPRTPALITITPDRHGINVYGGGKLTRGETLKDGIARVKELLHEVREAEKHADA